VKHPSRLQKQRNEAGEKHAPEDFIEALLDAKHDEAHQHHEEGNAEDDGHGAHLSTEEGGGVIRVNLERMAQLVAMLRACGVRVYKSHHPTEGGIELELGPPVDNTPAAKPEAEAPWCKCGHGEAEHGGGYCLRGCDVEKCGEEPAK
jgi:hypothetical protein